MKLEEAIQRLKEVISAFDYDPHQQTMDTDDVEAIYMAIDIMERLEDSVPGHPKVEK